jgi:uncharacterized protein DUF397
METGNAPLIWRKSTRCESGYCVEVALTADGALVRDAKRPEDGRLAFDRQAWSAFLVAVKDGAFDAG